jgi:hypothetical protein
MIRLVHMLRRKPGLSPRDFAAIWRDSNGPLVASLQTDLDLVRYVQLHPDPAALGLDTKAAEARGGMEQPFDGIAEYWWKSADALAAALSTGAGASGADRLVASEREFVDLPASPLWFATEFPQVATGLYRPVARLRSSIMRLHFALRARDGLGDAETKRYWLEDHGPLIRSHAPARGLLAYNQVHRRDSPLEAVFRESRGTVADAYLGHAESWFERPDGSAPRPEQQSAIDAAIEDERAFIDWRASTILVGKELLFVDREWAL